MLFSRLRVFLPALALALLGAAAGLARAHTVPNMTLEAAFAADGGFTLAINIDPRTFMAADPTTLPPVPASWYRDQTQEQVAATHQKARAYLGEALRLVFSGTKVPLPECRFQPIDGADNTPMDAETQEVHLLATAHGTLPQGATAFQVDFAKAATTSLILLTSQSGKTSPRAQVVFPGELSPPVALRRPDPAPPPAAAPPPVRPQNRIWVVLVAGAALIILIIGWRLLVRYRHHHRFHARPRSM